jgi:hypothetical protein
MFEMIALRNSAFLCALCGSCATLVYRQVRKEERKESLRICYAPLPR